MDSFLFENISFCKEFFYVQPEFEYEHNILKFNDSIKRLTLLYLWNIKVKEFGNRAFCQKWRNDNGFIYEDESFCRKYMDNSVDVTGSKPEQVPLQNFWAYTLLWLER